MALRTSKITSEIIQTGKKYFSSNADSSLKNKLSATLATENNFPKPQKPFRYKIANTEKPQGLPQLSFQDEETPLFAELQPSAKSEFRFDYNPSKWADKPIDNSPFPQKIKQKSEMSASYTDQQKADDKFVKFKMGCYNPPARSFSTVTSALQRHYSQRSPADNNSHGSCKNKIDKCVKKKSQKGCKMANKDCPRFTIRTCKQSKGSNCKLNYLNPNCTKKFAPYPSYSEACAENLPEDPSECQQCPWRICDDADTIKPGTPVRSRRNYSTYSHLDTVRGVVSPHLPPSSAVQDYMCDRKCGVTKKPCKEPPGPCEVRKQKEQQRHNKNRSGDSKKKKASDFENGMVLSGIEVKHQDVIINPYTLEPVRITLDNPGATNQASWIDIFDGPEVLLDKKRKHPNCHSHKRPKRPKSNVVGDLLLANPGMSLKKHDGKRIKGDEGHPPPCQGEIDSSKNCPKEKMKKPKYKKRPMTNPMYKNPEDPYTQTH